MKNCETLFSVFVQRQATAKMTTKTKKLPYVFYESKKQTLKSFKSQRLSRQRKNLILL